MMPVSCKISKPVLELKDAEQVMSNLVRVPCKGNVIVQEIMRHYNHDKAHCKIPLLNLVGATYHVKLMKRDSESATFVQSCVNWKSSSKYTTYNPRRVVLGFE